MYKMIKAKEVLEMVKETLLKQEENIDILEQSQYTSVVSALPSLKTESFILFRNKKDNVLYVAKTEHLQIKKILSVDEFKESVNKLPNYEKIKLTNIINEIEKPNNQLKV